MTETTVSEPVYKAVERILDEHSAWIARPSPDVTKRIAFVATIAAHSAVEIASTAWCDEIAARVDALGYDGQAAIEALPELVEALAGFVERLEWNGRRQGWDVQCDMPAGTVNGLRAALARIRRSEP